VWAEKSETIREEYKAYSLLGIFDIQIPVLYGERREKVFKQLREEIDKLSKGLNNDFIVCHTLLKRPSTRIIGSTNLPASLKPTSTVCVRYAIGLVNTIIA